MLLKYGMDIQYILVLENRSWLCFSLFRSAPVFSIWTFLVVMAGVLMGRTFTIFHSCRVRVGSRGPSEHYPVNTPPPQRVPLSENAYVLRCEMYIANIRNHIVITE
mmetsp:Transcript_27328/g.63469  ORF Transcript_27328/g.63469 Transcript_27328/m.63469 type:complete len:106 (+) Transcript_27328:1508-1825(+)